jgi:hypothetical protein
MRYSYGRRAGRNAVTTCLSFPSTGIVLLAAMRLCALVRIPLDAQSF